MTLRDWFTIILGLFVGLSVGITKKPVQQTYFTQEELTDICSKVTLIECIKIEALVKGPDK